MSVDMKAIVASNFASKLKSQVANCRFVKTTETHWIHYWRSYIQPQDVRKADAIEFFESALSKWELYATRGRIATSILDFKKQIKRDSHVDTLAMFVIDANWWKTREPFPALPPKPMGFCQFRRTWCNNIAVDYIAAHPVLLDPNPPVLGVGTALLYQVAIVAKNLGAKSIWLETTDLSLGYYRGMFGTKAASDLLILPASVFYQSLHRRFAGARMKK